MLKMRCLQSAAHALNIVMLHVQEMMKAELWRFSRRQLSNVLKVSGDEQFIALIVMLKLMETHIINMGAVVDNVFGMLRAGAHGGSVPTDGGRGDGEKPGNGNEGEGKNCRNESLGQRVESLATTLAKAKEQARALNSQVKFEEGGGSGEGRVRVCVDELQACLNAAEAARVKLMHATTPCSKGAGVTERSENGCHGPEMHQKPFGRTFSARSINELVFSAKSGVLRHMNAEASPREAMPRNLPDLGLQIVAEGFDDFEGGGEEKGREHPARKTHEWGGTVKAAVENLARTSAEQQQKIDAQNGAILALVQAIQGAGDGGCLDERVVEMVSGLGRGGEKGGEEESATSNLVPLKDV